MTAIAPASIRQPTTRAFLTSRWQNLIMLTYAVPPSVLEPFLPPHCELDTIDDDAFISIVAFDFANTRVANIAWPGHVNFPEINLRFYLRHADQHGVCFLREFISKPLVATVARLFYNEPYRLAPLTSRVTRTADQLQVEHRLKIRSKTYRIQATADPAPYLPKEWEPEFFFLEQRFGFGTSRCGKLLRYHVQHAPWKIHPIQNLQLDWNWEKIYGPRWAFLQNQQPHCTMLVAGSPVHLSPGIIAEEMRAADPLSPYAGRSERNWRLPASGSG